MTLYYKHCQRHNGPEDWVHLTKVTSWGHITSSNTNVDHIFLQNLDNASTKNLKKTSASPLNLKFKILAKPTFGISTKIQLHNFYKTSAEKNWPNSIFKSCLNFNFKILTKPCAQSLNKSLAFWPNLSFQICNKLLPTRSSSSTSTTVTTSTSFEWESSHNRVTSIKFTKQESVSEWVSHSLTSNDRTRVR